MATPSSPLDPFVRQATVLLTTYRRDGTPVGTPVNIAVVGPRAVIRTWDTAGKTKRIRRHPLVDVAPATNQGHPTGPALRARARVLDGDEATQASRALARKYRVMHGLLVPLLYRLQRTRTVHIELTPLDG